MSDLVEVAHFSDSPRPDVPFDPDAPPFVIDGGGQRIVNVFGYQDVQNILQNPDRTYSRSLARLAAKDGGDTHATYNALWGTDPFQLGDVPGRHAQLRQIVEPWFRTKAVRALEPQIRKIAQELLHNITSSGSGQFDLARDFAYELSIRVICKLIGWDTDRADWWRLKLDEHVQAPSFDQLPRQRDIDDEVMARVYERRQAKSDELIDVLIRAEQDGRITEKDIVSFVWMFVAAGTDTTAIAITNAIGLLDEYGQLEYIRSNLDDQRVLRRAVEETLRFGFNFDSTYNLCVGPTLVGGIDINPGDAVIVWYPAANRSHHINGTSYGAASPLTFDINRSPNNHLAFGDSKAPHMCLGAALARLEVGIAIQEVLKALPKLQRTDEPLVRWAGITDGFAKAPFAFDVGQ